MPKVHRLIERIPQCQRYNEYDIRPIYTTFWLVNIWNVIEPFFKETIKKEVKRTTNNVAILAYAIGKNIKQIIIRVSKNGGILSITFTKKNF